MDNVTQSYNQFYQATSFHNSSKNNDLNKHSSTKTQFNNYDIKIIQKINEQNSVIEKNGQNLNTDTQNSQLEGIQSIEHQKIMKMINFSDLIQTSNQKNTQRRGKNNQSFFRSLEIKGEESKDNDSLGIIFQNKQSIVDLKFDNILNKFVVTKENLGQKNLFKKEYKTLALLKDTNVTLDLVSTMQNDYKFQQIAGKTNLNLLKYKMKDQSYTFGLLYFKLLDKLNKMHEKGIAHSDIKPQNIVLSFDNEPFFIDFGASIYLFDENQYDDYLNYFTPEFNLHIYKQPSSKEEIKLCDMTQLSLSFLYLLCYNSDQLQLFFSKNYNELFQNLIDNENNNISDQMYNSKINIIIVLYNISRILNLADPKINVINEGKDQQFLNDETQIQKSLNYSNDVIFENNVYIVRYIDKFSILLIYFYDKQGYNLKIVPQNVFITILDNMKEYQYISQKYKINEYFLNLENSQIDLNDSNQFNISEYIKIQDIKRLNIKFFSIYQVIRFWVKLLKSKLKDTLEELNMVFDIVQSEHTELIQTLRQQIPKFYVFNFQISEFEISCRIIKDSSNSLLISDANLRIEISKKNLILLDYFELIQSYYKIQQLDIYLIDFLNYFQILQDLKKKVEQINQKQQYSINIQFDKLIKSKARVNIEQFIYETFQLQEIRQKVIIKFYDYIFNDLLIWKQIKNIIENQVNFDIQILIINGKFNKQVVKMLKDIQFISDKVKYQFEDEYIQKQEDEYFYKYENELNQQIENIKQQENEKYSLNVKFCSQSQCEQSLNIIFYKKLILQKQLKHKNSDEQQIFLDKLEVFNNNIINPQKQQNMNELVELKLQYEQQIYIQQFKFINRKVEIQYNINEIDYIIKQIYNNNHYSKIKILDQINEKIYFVFKQNDSITEISICLDREDINKLSQFKQLYLAISNNCDSLKIMLPKKVHALNNKISISQKIKYQSYHILQKIQHSYQLQRQMQNIFWFLEQSVDNQQDSNKARFLFLSYSVEFDKAQLIYNQIDQIRGIYIDHKFKDNINHFQKYSITKTILPKQIFQKKQFLLQIDFESQQIGDHYFNILFNQIEKQFPQNKMYNLKDCGITGQTLLNIYETIKTHQIEHKIYFDLTKNNISFNDFKQFMNKLQLNSLFNHFIFQIRENTREYKYYLLNSMQDIVEIIESDNIFILKVKVSSTQFQDKRIKIDLDFSDIRITSLLNSNESSFQQNQSLNLDIDSLQSSPLRNIKQFQLLESATQSKQEENMDQIEDFNSIENLQLLDFNSLKELIESNI